MKVETKIGICTPMFIAALLIVTKTWTKSRGPLTDDQVNKMYYRHTMEYFSIFKWMGI